MVVRDNMLRSRLKSSTNLEMILLVSEVEEDLCLRDRSRSFDHGMNFRG